MIYRVIWLMTQLPDLVLRDISLKALRIIPISNNAMTDAIYRLVRMLLKSR